MTWLALAACWLFVGILVAEVRLTVDANRRNWAHGLYERLPLSGKMVAYSMMAAFWPVTFVRLVIDWCRGR